MNKPNDKRAAFTPFGQDGLTKREYAAIHIAAGMVASPMLDVRSARSGWQIAQDAVVLTDRLFVELDK